MFDISSREFFPYEFSVYAALEFELFIPYWEIAPHLERLIVHCNFYLSKKIDGLESVEDILKPKAV